MGFFLTSMFKSRDSPKKRETNRLKMAWDLPPSLGIGIPVLLISSIGYGGHLLIFRKYLSTTEQIWFQSCLTILWISYIMAIFKDPGSPPKNFEPLPTQWRKWCKKCEHFKPERTHHCKTCRKCVLGMDHHCPWIANCIGHDNMPHFLRFLLWVDYTNGYAFVHLCKRVYALWQNRELPIYLTSKLELTAVIILTPLSLLVLVTVGTMTLRWLYSIAFTGMTQIESWEYERIESHIKSARFIEKIKHNYELFNGRELQSISTWSSVHRMVKDQDEDNDGETSSSPIDIDDIVFPYDLNPWKNLVNAWGYPWTWMLPWGSALGDGITYPKNEYVIDPSDGSEQDLSSIPWPPDGYHDVGSQDQLTSSETKNIDHWCNEYGESIADFGVDPDS